MLNECRGARIAPHLLVQLNTSKTAKDMNLKLHDY